MPITKQIVADRIAEYLRHRITLGELVNWAEKTLMNGELEPNEAQVLSTVLARLGVADVRAFGLTWEDCEHALNTLGFTPHVSIVAA